MHIGILQSAREVVVVPILISFGNASDVCLITEAHVQHGVTMLSKD